MASRLNLQTELETLLGSRNVYYQPPASVQMEYPAIVYSLSDIRNTHATNGVYKQDNAYSLTYITRDPDDENIHKISLLRNCRFDRSYKSENLNHYVYTLYY